jgi:orotate phosphoribosyltransferase
VDSKALFKDGDFINSSGQELPWKIDCDAFIDEDWKTLAKIIDSHICFGHVEGVPRGGLKLAEALMQFCTIGKVLIVDDVLTTGESMMRQRQGRDALGVVVYDRSVVGCSNWIIPIFRVFRTWLP